MFYSLECQFSVDVRIKGINVKGAKITILVLETRIISQLFNLLNKVSSVSDQFSFTVLFRNRLKNVIYEHTQPVSWSIDGCCDHSFRWDFLLIKIFFGEFMALE